MLAGNAKRIFCDNVTCFGTNESCWNRSHLPEFFIKAPHFLLAWLLCFFTQTPLGSTFFWEAIFVTPAIVLARTIHTLAWKIRVEKCHLSFWYGILPGFLFVFRHGVETSNLGDVSAQELCQAIKATHMMSIRPKMQEARKKGWESWSSTFQSCFSMFQIKRRVVGLYRAFSNRPWYYQFGYRM